MKKDIAPEVLAFLKNLPNMTCAEKQEGHGSITEEDVAHIKIMLSNATDPKTQADREAFKTYILNSNFENNIQITDADRKGMLEYLRKYAPEFYKLIQTS